MGRSTRSRAAPPSPRQRPRAASKARPTTPATASSTSLPPISWKGTLAEHFAGQKDLILLAIDSESLGERLQWEPSRGGALFPHLYGPLDLKALLWDEPLELGADGRHRLPARVLP